MSGLVESATAILSLSERRLEQVSSNVSNATSSGFKRQLSFTDVMSGDISHGNMTPSAHADLSQGNLSKTGNPLDLAINGSAFFLVRSGNQSLYTRQGHFHLSPDGFVVTPQGYVLQQSGGGDLALDHAAVEILDDGTVLDQERPIGRIALLTPADASRMSPIGGSYFAAADDDMAEADGALVRQGMIESSNVVLGEEMVTMMSALREAESGARIMQTYDELMGRAISTLGQAGR